MKQRIRRILSTLLAICLIVGLLPANPAQAADYERWGGIIHMGWIAEEERWAWETWTDYDDPTLPRQYNGELPEGVSFDENTNTLTLENTTVTNLVVEQWGDTPLNIVISGEVTITSEEINPWWGALPALLITRSSYATISGANTDRSDRLNLYSSIAHALRLEAGKPFSENEDSWGEGDNDSMFTVRNLTLSAVSDYHKDTFDPGDPWRWTAISSEGGTTFENVDLTADGTFGISAHGNITFDSCHITAPSVELGALEKRLGLGPGDGTNYYENESYIKDSTITIKAEADHYFEEHHNLFGVHQSVLNIEGDSHITIDISEAPPFVNALTVANHYGLQLPVATGLNMKSGTLDIILQPGSTFDGQRSFVDPCNVDNGAVWTQTGGDVTITFDSGNGDYELHAISFGTGASFNLSGGTFTVNNLNDEDIYDTKIMALCGWEDSSLNFSGGTFTATGTADKPYDLSIWVWEEMAVTGDALLDLKATLQTETMTSHIEIFGGEININSVYGCVNIGSALSVYGGTMNLTAPNYMEAIYAYQGNVRFLGGEVNITAGSALTWQSRENQITFGDGIKAAFPDGTEAVIHELYYGDIFLGWATSTDYIYGEAEAQTVIIKRQGVKSDVTESVLTFDVVNTSAFIAGVPVNFRVIPTLAATEDTLRVTLPDSLLLNGVTVNNLPVTPIITEDGFEVHINNGDIVRFSATASEVGETGITVSVSDASRNLSFTIDNYTLKLPTTTKYDTFTVFGTAAPGATVTFREVKGNTSSFIGSTIANAAGTWKASIRVSSEAGYHTIYATITMDGETLATTDSYVVYYDNTRAAVETLTITNTIHGATLADPNEEVSVTLNYIDGTRSKNYYIYWPDLPEFRFDVKFEGEKSTPEHVTDVAVVATDSKGVEERVPLTYDALSGLWRGVHNFCDGENIVPDMFRVVWREVGVTEDGETEDVEMPSVEDAPPEYDEDYTTGTIDFADAGTYRVTLADGANLAGITDINGAEVPYTLDELICEFTVESGEFYTVKLQNGTFDAPFAGYDTLYVIGNGDTDPIVTYNDDVQLVSSDTFAVFDSDSKYFVSDNEYAMDDILLIDEATAIVVTDVDGDNYFFRDANIDEVYATLDVSVIDPDGIQFEIDEEEIARQFMETPLYANYIDAIKVAFEDKYEIGDHKVTVNVTASADTDGVISLKPEIIVTTEGKTKLPFVGETDTEIVTTFSHEIVEDLDFRVRFDTEKMEYSVYFAVNETITSSLDINITVGEDGTGGGLDKYFEIMEGDVIANFLEAIQSKIDEGAEVEFARLLIPTPAPSVYVFFEPSIEINWGFYGEFSLGAQLTNSSKSGFAVTYLNNDWSTATFAKREEPHFSTGASLHIASSVEMLMRMDGGVTILNMFDAGLYVKAGPRLAINGHGSVGYDTAGETTGWDAELFARLTLKAEAGAHFSLGFGRIEVLAEDIPLYASSENIAEIGWDQMPTQFASIEGPEPTLMPKKYKIVERLNLAMKLQSFNGSAPGTKVYDENNYERYTFEVESGPVAIEGKGENATLIVLDPLKPCEYSIRITFKSNRYELYKVVPLKYEPGYIDIYVSAEEAPPIAGIEIISTDDTNFFFAGSTDASGHLTVKVPEGSFSVAQTSPPPENILVSESPLDVYVSAGGEGSASFANEKPDEPDDPPVAPGIPGGPGSPGGPGKPPEDETPDFPLPGSGDPSGYVYEGIETNRLDGVTTTLYYKPTEDSDEISVWDASTFDQENPLFTDELGQYLWMVPSGWWQVKYELDGYTTVFSEWMEVPPIRTGVNVNLTSTAPAQMTLEYVEEEGTILLRFNRPVKMSTIKNLVITIDGVRFDGYHELAVLDAAWSVTDDPMDSTLCATAFRLWIDTNAAGRRVEVSISGTETYNSVLADVSGSVKLPGTAVYYTVSFDANGGTGSMSNATNIFGEFVLPECGFTAPDGMKFRAWNINGEDRFPGETIIVAMDTVVVATWEELPEIPEISGTCGENLTWTLNGDGTLTVHGEGAMDSFTPDDVPWRDYCEMITKVVIEDGVTSIGSYAFVDCSALREVRIPVSVTNIADHAFSGCNALEKVTYDGSKEQWDEIEIGIGNEPLNSFAPGIADIMLGDVNGDGKVNGTDTNLIFRYVSGTAEFTDEQCKAADVNGDGKVNGTDTNLVFRFVSGTIDALG